MLHAANYEGFDISPGVHAAFERGRLIAATPFTVGSVERVFTRSKTRIIPFCGRGFSQYLPGAPYDFPKSHHYDPINKPVLPLSRLVEDLSPVCIYQKARETGLSETCIVGYTSHRCFSMWPGYV